MAERTVTLLFYGLFIALVVRYGPESSMILNAVGTSVMSVFGTLLGGGSSAGTISTTVRP